MTDGCVTSLERLSNRVVYFSWAACALGLLTSYFSWLELRALQSLDPSGPYSWEVDYIDSDLILIAGVGALFYLIAFVVAGFLSLRWIYRANLNAHCLNGDMSMSPGLNVGWFFVPIATWWKPYEGVREVWQVSADPQSPNSVERPSLLVRWWTFWLLANITGTVSFRLQMRANTVGAASLADTFDVVSGIALVPATYFFLLMVRQVTTMQQRFVGRQDESEVALAPGSGEGT